MSTSHTSLVVGAGIAGAAAAYALARRGSSVTVVDAQLHGKATDASAGIIQPWAYAENDAFYELYHAGAAAYPALLADLRSLGVTHTDFRRSGALLVNRDRARLEEAAERVSARAEESPALIGSVELIDNARARELFPPLAADLHATYIEGGARVDGRTMRDALLDGVRALGGVTTEGHVELRVTNDAIEAVIDGAVRTADAVVVAAGAWTTTLLASIGVELAVEPQRGQITHVRLTGVDTSNWPTVHPLSHHYIVAFDEGRIAVGATRETGSGFDPRVTAAGQAQVLNDALGIAPGLADATIIETRVGLRPLPDGKLPTVRAIDGVDRLYVATGYGAAGLTMGPMLGDALARHIFGLDAPELTNT